ncbi:MAG: DUF952 domain-containing protein [Sphingobacteriales bacterium]|nr:MAG: DUF952 domain-containing protein [Sphingobacteriales bacterium]
MIYHITTKQQWAVALQLGYYTAPSLQSEGFIHCCSYKQIAGVLERYYASEINLLQLTIDTLQLNVPLKYESSPTLQDQFPHVYGTISLNAIVNIFEI